MAVDPVQASAVLAGSGSLPVLGMPGAVLLALALGEGRLVRHEGFPDRAYADDGRLVPRDVPGALVTDPAEWQPGPSSWPRSSIRSACTGTARARWRPPTPYAERSRPRVTG